LHARGGKGGQQRKTKDPRSASTINIELRAIRTILGYLRKLGLLPHIDTDYLKDGLERLAVSHERGHFLKPHELQKLLDAARSRQRARSTPANANRAQRHVTNRSLRSSHARCLQA